MTAIALGLLALLGAVVLHDAVRRPLIRRLALRGAVRRPSETALVAAGSLLGAAVITASLLVGDTLRDSVRQSARTQLGPVDLAVRVADPARLDAVERALAGRLPGADGVVRLVRSRASVVAPGSVTRAEPVAALVEVDPAAGRRFGGDVDATGLAEAGPALAPGEALAGRDIAETLGIGPGDRVVAYAQGGRATLRVRGIVPRLGLAGFWPEQGAESPNLLVAPGTVARLARQGGDATGTPPELYVLVSGRGGVMGGAAGTEAIRAEIARRLGALDRTAEVVPIKRDRLAEADEAGRTFTEMFGAMGAVGVLAGMLLLVNVFVMLAEERTSELGTLRALGLKRGHMARAFALEGAVYGVVGAAVGALVGIGVARLIVGIAIRLFNSSGEGVLFELRFAPPPGTVLTGFALGAAVSLATVWLTGARIARMNVIRAIRDLPAPPRDHAGRRLAVLGAVLLVAGAVVAVAGALGGSWPPALLGPVAAAGGAALLAARRAPARWAATAACLLVIAWAVAAFRLIPSLSREIPIPAYVAQGVVAVGAGVVLATIHAGRLSGVVRGAAGTRRGLAARLGLAYPLARPFRTGMLLGVYALVVFTLVFIAVFDAVIQSERDREVGRAAAGYELVIDSSPGNPAPRALLAAQPGVAAVAPLLRAMPQFAAARHPDPMRWPMTAFDDAMLARGAPELGERLARFPSDRAVWEAVARSDRLAIVPSWFLQGGGPPRNLLRPGETLVMRNPSTGARRELLVAGVIDSDWTAAGVWTGTRVARGVMGREAVPSRAFASVAPGRDPAAVAAALTGGLVGNGVDAETTAAVVDRGLGVSRAFFALMEGYIALSLVIGVAGLGVVMVRAVRERRREIGTLRALGFPARVVGSAFAVEAGFIAASGVLIGAALALLSAWQVVELSGTFGDGVSFTAPWLAIAGLVAVTLAASEAAALAPAVRASRVRPAVALRVGE